MASSSVYFNENFAFYCKDYYDMIVGDVRKIINDHVTTINIIVGDYTHIFPNDNKTIKIGINFEHTLVLQGGRDSNNAPVGNITWNDNQYLVRYENIPTLHKNDIVIDYSVPNIYNILSFKEYQQFEKKFVYYPPILFDYVSDVEQQKEIQILTTFIDLNQPRRQSLLENFKKNGIENVNRNDVFGSENLKALYRKTKILVNIHQTDHHHTFEELRVLPALMCNTVVISEKSPLMELIPYRDFIIWCTYDEIIETVKTVQTNYNDIHDAFFGNDRFQNLILSMKQKCFNDLKEKISNLV